MCHSKAAQLMEQDHGNKKHCGTTVEQVLDNDQDLLFGKAAGAASRNAAPRLLTDDEVRDPPDLVPHFHRWVFYFIFDFYLTVVSDIVASPYMRG